MFTFPFGFYAPSGYQSVGSDFDGTNDYLTRGADLTGNADGKTGLLSFWIRPDVDATTLNIYTQDVAAGAFGLQIQLSSSGYIIIQGHDTADAEILNIRSTIANFTVANGWRHVLASWDLAANSSFIYVDDASSQTVTTRVNSNINYTTLDHIFGYWLWGGSKMNGCLSEFYFNNSAYMDLSVEANRRKFISVTGTPVSLGVNGALPTGASPIIYLKDASGSFQTNYGTGGNFTVTGALSTCSTTPP